MTDTPQNDARPVPVPSGRFTRMAQLGGMTASVAGNMAVGGLAQLGRGQRPAMRDLLLTPRNMRRVADQLAKMRGAAMKVGQLVSMDTGDVLPPELAEIMARLRNDAHFMPPAQLKTMLAAQWPADWMRQFKRFDVRPIAAASIGQVHRAQTRDGRDLAIKVQYPGVARSIDSDVSNVGVLIRASGLLPSGFELAPYLEEARSQLHEETDYALEARHLQSFADQLAEDTRFIVPGFHSDLSTGTVLAMDYVEAAPIESVEQADAETRSRVARDLIDLTLSELFTFGVMQTDPNFANYRYEAASGKIVLLDFGATRWISPEVLDQYRDILRAGLAMDIDAVAQVATRMGALPEDCAPKHRQRLVKMMRMAFVSLETDGLYDFADMTLSRQMQAEGIALAEDGFLPPPVPMDLLYVQRKLAGMFLLAARLRAKLPLRQMMQEHVG